MDNQKTKKIILASVFIVAVVVAIILVVILSPNNSSGTTNNGKPVKTEIGTDVDGNWIVTQGTSPDGVVIENGTYPDGTRVGVAIGESGEPATQSDGSYVINYPVYDQSSDDNNKSDNNDEQSSTSKSDSNSKTSASSSSKPKDNSSSSKASSSSASSSSASSSKPSSSSTSSKPSSSSQTSKPTSKPNTSSSTPTPSSSTPQGDSDQKSTVIIDGTKYQIGDKIKVSYYLTLPIKFTGINASIMYDSNVLNIVEETTEMPNLSNAMCNEELKNELRFTAVSARAVNDFSTEKLLVSCIFEVKNNSTTSSEINLNIAELLDDDIQNISGDNYTIRAELSKE